MCVPATYIPCIIGFRRVRIERNSGLAHGCSSQQSSMQETTYSWQSTTALSGRKTGPHAGAVFTRSTMSTNPVELSSGERSNGGQLQTVYSTKLRINSLRAHSQRSVMCVHLSYRRATGRARQTDRNDQGFRRERFRRRRRRPSAYRGVPASRRGAARVTSTVDLSKRNKSNSTMCAGGVRKSAEDIRINCQIRHQIYSNRCRYFFEFYLPYSVQAKGPRKIYHVNHHRPHSAFGAAKNHVIDAPIKKMPPALKFPHEIK